MPLIETANQQVKKLRGFHLYHFWLSSCSQRVRVVLAEKHQAWESHEINLEKQEHATEEYQSIHPNGLVPALVHDGQVIIESIDIIDYLDQTFPKPSLRPSSNEGKPVMHKWMRKADGAQHSIKTLTHEFLFKPHRMPPDVLEKFVATHQNEELTNFMKVWSSDASFPKSEIDDELKLQHDCFVELDQALEGSDWLVEDKFSLADIAWIPNVHRLGLMMYPLDRHPNLKAWYERFQTRPSYADGITSFEIPDALAHFKDYSVQRAREGTGVAAFGPLAT